VEPRSRSGVQQPRSVAELAGWVPFDLADRPDGTVVQWIDLGDTEFSDPFFRDTINRRREQQDARILETGLQPLCELPAFAPHLRPSGFVFHASRAGSTLLSNALKAMDDNLVLVEPNPLNQMLGSPARRTHPTMWDQLFKGLTACLGQPRRAAQSRYFIKFSSHNVLQVGDILRCYPNVPWIFLYRDPAEIIASALRSAPGWLAHLEAPEKAEAIFGISADAAQQMDRTEFGAAVLERFFDAALAAGDDQRRFLNYRHLRQDTIASVLRPLGLAPDKAAEDRMRTLFNYDSKSIRKKPFEDRNEATAYDSEVTCPESLLQKFRALESQAFVPQRSDSQDSAI